MLSTSRLTRGQGPATLGVGFFELRNQIMVSERQDM